VLSIAMCSFRASSEDELLAGFQSASSFPTRLRPPGHCAPAVQIAIACLSNRLRYMLAPSAAAFREGRRSVQVSPGERLATSAFLQPFQPRTQMARAFPWESIPIIRSRDSGPEILSEDARPRPILGQRLRRLVTLPITTRARLRSHLRAKALPRRKLSGRSSVARSFPTWTMVSLSVQRYQRDCASRRVIASFGPTRLPSSESGTPSP